MLTRRREDLALYVARWGIWLKYANFVKFKKEIKSICFKCSKVENYVFFKCTNDYKVLITFYADDLLIFGSNIDCVNETKHFLMKIFDIKD